MNVIKVFMVVRWPVGGIRTFINYVYSEWPDNTIQLHILTPDIAEVAVLKEQLQGIDCHWYATESHKPSFKEFLGVAVKLIRCTRFDVIHAHGFTSALAVSPVLPFIKAKSIFTSHDVLRDNQFHGVGGKLKKLVVPLALNRFSVIHSVSYDADKNLKEYFPFVDKKKCKVILNGIKTERFYSSEPAKLRETMILSDEVCLIGFFGRFMSQKGFRYLVEAMAHLDDRFPNRFRVVCFGSGAFIREEKVVLEQKKLSHLFHFYDFVADTAPYIKGCDMVVMPSLWEACPLVPMEVLTSGIPLIASSCIGLREVCAGTPAVMVSPGDGKLLAEGILQINDQKKLEAQDYAFTAKIRFDISSVRSNFQSMYSALASN